MLYPSFHFRPISQNYKYFPKPEGLLEFTAPLLLLVVYPLPGRFPRTPHDQLTPALSTLNRVTSFCVLLS